jgi:hypothetical protein
LTLLAVTNVKKSAGARGINDARGLRAVKWGGGVDSMSLSSPLCRLLTLFDVLRLPTLPEKMKVRLEGAEYIDVAWVVEVGQESKVVIVVEVLRVVSLSCCQLSEVLLVDISALEGKRRTSTARAVRGFKRPPSSTAQLPDLVVDGTGVETQTDAEEEGRFCRKEKGQLQHDYVIASIDGRVG